MEQYCPSVRTKSTHDHLVSRGRLLPPLFDTNLGLSLVLMATQVLDQLDGHALTPDIPGTLALDISETKRQHCRHAALDLGGVRLGMLRSSLAIRLSFY